ncbi:hypothetical protein LAV84_27125 [Rhizobium sp. VS19-DR104.2]|uniref:hypothetical protein n=1 Tax=unclassified Rhizobium TaxID=2613769 RepID=UPI001C5B15B8|nr:MULTISPECIES: hypothetical protein [unclassified Rhizobium]MBZ5763243.1 hypothetical protein [Rhizobium sp. VS19-DR96]MBZ5769159.1 hypothetical protein [Rhizobium sp. VS19-DR129.2]MBZ5776713.1 hypothetical protein [Rhizobium sp. VS19-DRK62.2]MBZ5787830.1 hypothetical protein [Rhizobium sp. VS19-DR121]MBZ5805225.1 hypothetical protein [Rhizobium sp. VS19-DR181]
MGDRRMTSLSASLYAADPFRLVEEIEAVSPHVESFHLDIMDGMFAPEFGLTTRVAKELLERTAVPLDVHLMVEHPASSVIRFSEMGVRSIAIHLESTNVDFAELVAIARTNGVKAYAALRHTTSTSALHQLLSYIDGCLMLTAPAGGGEFDRTAFDRLKELPAELYTIVDGKISTEHFDRLNGLNVDLAVVGAALFADGQAGSRSKSLAVMLENKRSLAHDPN